MTAPLIIPILVVIVVVVAVVLLIYHLIRKLVGCPNQKHSYPFDPKSASKRKSTLPASPYTIEPSGDTSGSFSGFFGKGSGMLYPALAAGSRSHHSSSPGRRSSLTDTTNQDQSFSLDTVDNTLEEAAEVLIGVDTPSPAGSNTTREEHGKLPISRTSYTPDIPTAPSPASNYDDRSYGRHDHDQQQYDRQEQLNPSGSNNFESDV